MTSAVSGWSVGRITRRPMAGLFQARQHDIRGGLSVERRLRAERVVERGAEAVNVRAVIHSLAARFLRRDVVWRAPDFAAVLLPGHKPRKAEVRDFRDALLVKQDVCGLDVPVDQPDVVGGLEPFGHIDADLENSHFLHRVAGGDHLVETPAGDELHHDVGLALLLAA